MPNSAVLRDEHERSMFDLLEQVWDTIGNVDLHRAFVLVNRGFIPLETEGFPRLDQIEQRGVLCLRPNVEVAGIEPPTDI